MALSREYRIRELYLKHFEENFPRERTREFLSLLNVSEVRLLKRLARLSDPKFAERSQTVFNAYLYSLFEIYTRRRQRVSSLKEVRRFSHNFTFSREGDYSAILPDVVHALTHCKLWEFQEKEEADQLAVSIALFLEFLNSLHTITVTEFSASLKEFVVNRVSVLLGDERYLERVRLYGQLLQTTTRESSPIEAVRLALQCMPTGDQRSANIFLYIMFKVFGQWPEASAKLLHVPADNDLSRVTFRVGITQKKLGNLEYGTIGYSALQTLARRLIPENPSELYGLKQVAKIWCKSRSPDCDQCLMNSVCSYALSIQF